ncbi:MAG: LysM peptidoglycan-binding domain-containing protein [Pseudomonadota bacterium]|nr:LysM peptidoglycan-binding domain-containing protein [Pseudomonadota bacterium]
MLIKQRKLNFLLLLIFFVFPVYGNSLFQTPEGLEEDVEFWLKVFTNINTNQAFLHDSRYLGVIYEVIQIPKDASSSDRRRIADLAKDRYRNILKEISSDKSNLNDNQQRVLKLWPKDVTSDELYEASKRIRYQGGMSDRFLDGLQRAGAWRSYINAELAKYDVPQELSALPHVESSFNPEARSHVGASGLWQFTRSTGQRFMKINHVLDERRDPFFSTTAAAKLLANNYSKLKSWPIAITAYNHGVGGMTRAVKAIGSTDINRINKEYEGKSFGFASRNFYPAFLAALKVDNLAYEYFGKFNVEPEEDLLSVKIDFYVSVRTLINTLGLSLKTLKEYNPALLDPVWIGNKYVPKGYSLIFPTSAQFKSKDDFLTAIPLDEKFKRQLPDLFYIVRNGDSLSLVAKRYDTTIRELVNLNNLKSENFIRIGQRIRLPVNELNIDIDRGIKTYTVRKGDSLSKIAQKFKTTQNSLINLNNLKNKDQIFVDQVLVIGPIG